MCPYEVPFLSCFVNLFTIGVSWESQVRYEGETNFWVVYECVWVCLDCILALTPTQCWICCWCCTSHTLCIEHTDTNHSKMFINSPLLISHVLPRFSENLVKFGICLHFTLLPLSISRKKQISIFRTIFYPEKWRFFTIKFMNKYFDFAPVWRRDHHRLFTCRLSLSTTVLVCMWLKLSALCFSRIFKESQYIRGLMTFESAEKSLLTRGPSQRLIFKDFKRTQKLIGTLGPTVLLLFFNWSEFRILIWRP